MRGGVPLDIQVHPAGGGGGGCNGDGNGNGGSAALWVVVVFCFIILLFSVGIGSSPQTRERVTLQCQSLIEKAKHKTQQVKNKIHTHLHRSKAEKSENHADTQEQPHVALAEHNQEDNLLPSLKVYSGGTRQETSYQELEQDVQEVEQDVRKMEKDVRKLGGELGKKIHMKELRKQITESQNQLLRHPEQGSTGEIRQMGTHSFIRQHMFGNTLQKVKEERALIKHKLNEIGISCPHMELNGSHWTD